MLNRRHIRIKVLQLLYSKSTAKSDYKDLIKVYNNRSINFYRLFISYFLLFEKLFYEFFKKEKIISKKNYENDSSGIKRMVLKNRYGNISIIICSLLFIKIVYTQHTAKKIKILYIYKSRINEK